MIRFECPRCGQPVEVEEAFAGHKGRCPDCQQVIDIPGASPPQGPPGQAEDASRPLSTDDLGGRGPRHLTLPASITSVVVPAPGEQAAAPPGRLLAIAGLVLGCVPIVSIVGFVLAAAACSQASRGNGSPEVRRLARAAVLVAIIMTAVSVLFGLVVLVSVFQEAHYRDMLEDCQQSLATVAAQLDDYAAEPKHAGRYPASLSALDTSGHVGYYGYSDRCPETDMPFGYVAGLKPDTTSKAIILYDARPAHGCRTLFWARPPGRNVQRLNGDVEFLSEEDFAREMTEQRRRLRSSAGGEG